MRFEVCLHPDMIFILAPHLWTLVIFTKLKSPSQERPTIPFLRTWGKSWATCLAIPSILGFLPTRMTWWFLFLLHTDVHRPHPGWVCGQQLKTFRLCVQHDDAYEAFAGCLIPGIYGDRREFVHRAVHVGAQLSIDLREVPSERDTAEPELLLNVGEADLARLTRRVLPVVSRQWRQHQSLRRVHLAGDVAGRCGRLLSSSLRRRRRRRGVLLRRTVQPDFRAPRHQLSFPSDGSTGRHLTHHAHRHVKHQPCFWIVRFAEAHQLGVQLCAHLAWQEIRPAYVRRLAQIGEAVADEALGRFRTREETLDRATTVRGVAALREGRDVLQGRRILFRWWQNLSAQAAGPWVQAGSTMTLPVSASAFPRAIQAGAIVTTLVCAPRLRQAGRVVAFVVAAAHHLVHGQAAVGGVLSVVERHSTMTRCTTAARQNRRGRGGRGRGARCGQRIAALALSSHQLARVEAPLVLHGRLVNVYYTPSGLCDKSSRLSLLVQWDYT